ncbi:MAG: T9SS type A sorting domain-containing protein [Phaeodactylibacter sp.]|nr:T9SS type A sorting domain-containing protein [Phaeodactylibacter sp.]
MSWKTLLFTAAWLCLAHSVPSQVTFKKTYGQPAAYDEGNSIARAANGRLYTLGTRLNHGNNSLDFLLSALDEQGNELWSQTYGGAENEEGRKLLVREDGLLLFGYTQSFGSGGRDWWVVKTDFEGAVLWSQAYGGPDRDEGIDAAPGPGGDILLGGFRETGPAAGAGAWLARIDGQGNLLGSAYLQTEEEDVLFNVSATADGGWLVGWKAGPAARLTKLSSNLESTFWELENVDFNNFFSNTSGIRQLGSGDILVSGNGFGPWYALVSNDGDILQENTLPNFRNYGLAGSIGQADSLFYFLARPANLSGPGIVLATHAESGEVEDVLYFDNQLPKPNDLLVPDGILAGAFYITGMAATADGGQDAFVLKGLTDGATEWRTTYGQQGAVGDEFGFRVLEAQDGSFYLGTAFRGLDYNQYKASFSRAAADGNLIWTLDYGTEGFENQLIDMALLSNGNIAALGFNQAAVAPNAPPHSLFILQISPEGQLLEEKILPVATGAFQGGVEAMPDGGFITTAFISPAAGTPSGMHMARWSAAGSLVWERLYNTYNDDFIRPFNTAYSPYDQSIACAAYFAVNNQNTQYGVVKIDAQDGTILWTADKAFGSGNFSVVNTGPNGDIAASGLVLDAENQTYHSHTLWLDAGGNELAYWAYPAEGYHSLSTLAGIHFLPGNRYWSAGYRYPDRHYPNYLAPPAVENVQGVMAFYDDFGDITAEHLFGDEEKPLIFRHGSPASDGGFILIGSIYGAGGFADVYLLKTDAEGVVSTEFTFRPEGRLTLSPNPGAGRLRFDFHSPARGKMQAELYDMNGRRLWQGAFDKWEDVASRELDFTRLPSGNYLFSVLIDEQRHSGQWAKR